jgi:co-chaperonin GroES (HSP10)
MQTKIIPLRNNIMFRFLDETHGSKGKFQERQTLSGIIIPVVDSTQKAERGGEVLAGGPDAASQINVGDFILVEGLQWTVHTVIDGEKMWKTDDTKVLLVTDDVFETYGTEVTDNR